jgi:hypothetical protein
MTLGCRGFHRDHFIDNINSSEYHNLILLNPLKNDISWRLPIETINLKTVSSGIWVRYPSSTKLAFGVV